MTTSSNTIDTVARAEATSSNSSEVVARAARNNLPDENTLAITRDIIKYSESLSEEDLCICLISGELVVEDGRAPVSFLLVHSAVLLKTF